MVLTACATGYARLVFASPGQPAPPHPEPLLDDPACRRRIRLGFALSHPSVVVALALGADATTGLVGAAILAAHGLVELHWQVAERHAEPAGVPAAAVYSGPS